jgi:C4-dicarboxylate-specific signal transduction histidine kinase
MTSLVAMGIVAFGTGPYVAQFPSLLLWIVPPLLWAAVRFGPRGAAIALFSVAALSIWGTAHRLGAFVPITDADHVLSLQLFWVVLSLPVMLLAAVIRERDTVEAALEEQRNQLAHVTRVATVGELSGALAHELRQPLMSILANAQAGVRFLAAQPPALDQVQEILQDIAEQDRHAARVISGVQLFLKKGQPRFESLALETVVHDALALSRNAIALAAVEVETEFAGDLPRVHGDPIQLLQVTLNLIVNACEAMKQKNAAPRRLRVGVARNGPQQVELAIADSGVGLPDDEANRVFEPFFTTKEKGLGLGLTIGRTIARAHGGRLWAENNPDGGATFHLVLPAEGTDGHPILRRSS